MINSYEKSECVFSRSNFRNFTVILIYLLSSTVYSHTQTVWLPRPLGLPILAIWFLTATQNSQNLQYQNEP